MSVVSDIYDDLHTKIAAQLTSHTRIPNPYDLPSNNEQFLRVGYGMQVGPAVNPKRFVSCKGGLSREYIIAVTRKFFAREFDSASKGTTEKSLLEDIRLLKNDFQENNVLTVSQAGVQFFESDSGIFALTGQENIYVIEATVTVEHIENI